MTVRRRTPRTSLLATLLLAVAGCAASGAESAAVVMNGDLRFEPATVEVPLGGTVTWQNDGVTRHTATSVDQDREPTGVFDSGVILGTGTFSHTFEESGAYTYQCGIHGGEMVGVVAVSP